MSKGVSGIVGIVGILAALGIATKEGIEFFVSVTNKMRGQISSPTGDIEASLIGMFLALLLGSLGLVLDHTRKKEDAKKPLCLILAGVFGASVALGNELIDLSDAEGAVGTPIFFYSVLLCVFLVPIAISPPKFGPARIVDLFGRMTSTMIVAVLLGFLIQGIGEIIWWIDGRGFSAQKFVVAPSATVVGAAVWVVLLIEPRHNSHLAWQPTRQVIWGGSLLLLAASFIAFYGVIFMGEDHLIRDYDNPGVMRALFSSILVAPGIVVSHVLIRSKEGLPRMPPLNGVVLIVSMGIMFASIWLVADHLQIHRGSPISSDTFGRLAFAVSHTLTIPAVALGVLWGCRLMSIIEMRTPEWFR